MYEGVLIFISQSKIGRAHPRVFRTLSRGVSILPAVDIDSRQMPKCKQVFPQWFHWKNFCAVVGPAEAVARIDPAILVVWPRSRFSKGVSLLLQGDKALIYRPKHVVICFRVLGKPRITWSRQGAYFQHFFHHFCGIYGIYPAFLDSHCRPFRHPAGWWCFDVASQRQVKQRLQQVSYGQRWGRERLAKSCFGKTSGQGNAERSRECRCNERGGGECPLTSPWNTVNRGKRGEKLLKSCLSTFPSLLFTSALHLFRSYFFSSFPSLRFGARVKEKKWKGGKKRTTGLEEQRRGGRAEQRKKGSDAEVENVLVIRWVIGAGKLSSNGGWRRFFESLSLGFSRIFK